MVRDRRWQNLAKPPPGGPAGGSVGRQEKTGAHTTTMFSSTSPHQPVPPNKWGDNGAAGALASATLAEKKQGSRAPRGPKVSNNFVSFPARRNLARVAKIDGGVAEAEAAGGSPRKKPYGQSPQKNPHGKETFLLRLDRVKATAEQGRKEPIELEGDPRSG